MKKPKPKLEMELHVWDTLMFGKITYQDKELTCDFSYDTPYLQIYSVSNPSFENILDDGVFYIRGSDTSLDERVMAFDTIHCRLSQNTHQNSAIYMATQLAKSVYYLNFNERPSDEDVIIPSPLGEKIISFNTHRYRGKTNVHN